jgi:bifunctional DNA primase/polymerase-like protein
VTQPTVQQLRGDYKCSLIPVLLTKHPYGSLLPQVWDEADRRLKGVWKPYQTRHANEEEFSKWIVARPPAFAIVTGEISARVCFDFDGALGVALANKWGVNPHRRTGSGGFHLDTDHPGWYVPTLNGRAKQELGERWPGLDVKGDHGYAIAIGRNDIGAYEWLRDPVPDPMNVIPAEVWEFLAGHSNRKIQAAASAPPIRRTEASNGHARVSAELLIDRAITDARSNGRNNAGFTLACQLRDNHYGPTPR